MEQNRPITLKLAYLLDRPELCGGVKVIFQHASILLEQGVDVCVLGVGPAPDWISYEGLYIDIELNNPKKDAYDLVVATYWSTVLVAEELQLGPIVHYCQGYEANHPHLESNWSAIRAVYQRPYPCFAVSAYLKSFLESEHDKQAFEVPPPIDEQFILPAEKTLSQPFNIVLSGIYECSWKGIATGLEAFKIIRNSGVDCELTRISLTSISVDEHAIIEAENVFCGVPPSVVSTVTQSADLVIFPSQAEEGFGLPLIEAMVCGVPVVASDIPSVQQITEQRIALCSPNNPEEFAQQGLLLLTDKEAWQQRSKLGIELSSKYQVSELTNTLYKAISWAIAQYSFE